jgi:CheY-like chemotaxis protein
MSAPGDVLVVDDDEDMLEVIETVLQEMGYKTRLATNGRLALDAVAEAMPGLIVLDMLMPVMNGWEFVKEFRSRHGRDVPIIVVTAAEHTRSRVVDLDVTDVLPKPFEINALRKMVARHYPLPK